MLTVVATLCPAALPSELLAVLVQDTVRFADTDEATLLSECLGHQLASGGDLSLLGSQQPTARLHAGDVCVHLGVSPLLGTTLK